MYDQPVRKPFWRRVQEGPLFRKQFVERGKLGVVYGVDGLLCRFLEPGCNPLCGGGKKCGWGIFPWIL